MHTSTQYPTPANCRGRRVSTTAGLRVWAKASHLFNRTDDARVRLTTLRNRGLDTPRYYDSILAQYYKGVSRKILRYMVDA
jgi:hypothetical protein